MGAFECDNVGSNSNLDPKRLREECIIAFKVYDFCRQQDCLTEDVLGPARAARCTVLNGVPIEEGAIIVPPTNSAAVSIENLRVKKVIISDKTPNPFKNGFWDITLKYVFVYKLTFREVDGTNIGRIEATSIFTKKVTLFGSIDTDVKLSTDLFCDNCENNCDNDLNSGPFILVESKAVALSAELRAQNCCCNSDDVGSSGEPVDVIVTIGLFTIIKLYRITNLTVESRGFCIPDECNETSALNPCEFFDSLDFPMDIFAPPQKTEFFAGISSNIPAEHVQSENNCGCGCGCGSSNSGCGCN